MPEAAIALTRALVPGTVMAMRASDVIHMHAYLMHQTATAQDPGMPAYAYAGGDRMQAVMQYLHEHMPLLLATEFC